MRLELFDYPLPEERIAQFPIEPRDASRLLVLKADGTREHRRFLDLPEYLHPGDLLVFNDTRVLPARLHGRKETGARVEALLLQRLAPGKWEALAYPGRRLGPRARLTFGEGELRAEVVSRGEEGTRILQFEADEGPHAADELIHRIGEMPLPPYIHERLEDPERYQTIYAREEGSAAAPTAGLHFTPRVFEMLREKGVGIAYVTLHVGIGTFRPVKVDNVEEHEMHAEWYSVPPETAEAINRCTGRVIAVGTTTVRCLESAVRSSGKAELGQPVPPRVETARLTDPEAGGRRQKAEGSPLGTENSELGTRVEPGSGVTRLYLRPGDELRLVEGIVTNFHMPKSSLLILISAFAGLEPVRAAYEEALAQGYRFLSFGDAMFIEKPE